jgi:hypothetical protein
LGVIEDAEAVDHRHRPADHPDHFIRLQGFIRLVPHRQNHRVYPF